MSQLYRTGAVEIFAGVGGPADEVLPGRNVPRPNHHNIDSKTRPIFVGFCETHPRVEIVPRFKNLRSDATGDAPADVAWMGEEAFIFCDVIRFNEPTYARLASRPVFYQRRGISSARDVGSLMVRNKLTYRLWLRFPAAAFATMGGFSGILPIPFATGSATIPAARIPMPAGYRFPNAYLLGPDKLDPLGTLARKVQLVFHAVRVRQGTVVRNNPAPLQAPYLLYDHDMYGLPAAD